MVALTAVAQFLQNPEATWAKCLQRDSEFVRWVYQSSAEKMSVFHQQVLSPIAPLHVLPAYCRPDEVIGNMLNLGLCFKTCGIVSQQTQCRSWSLMLRSWRCWLSLSWTCNAGQSRSDTLLTLHALTTSVLLLLSLEEIGFSSTAITVPYQVKSKHFYVSKGPCDVCQANSTNPSPFSHEIFGL